jgi:hypothetical protein
MDNKDSAESDVGLHLHLDQADLIITVPPQDLRIVYRVVNLFFLFELRVKHVKNVSSQGRWPTTIQTLNPALPVSGRRACQRIRCPNSWCAPSKNVVPRNLDSQCRRILQPPQRRTADSEGICKQVIL